MKLNKKLFLIFLFLLILIIPQTIYANEVDLDVNSNNVVGDDYNLKLSPDNSVAYKDLNSVNGIENIKNEISSARDDNNLEQYSNGSSTVEDENYLVSENNNSFEDKTSEGFFNSITHIGSPLI